MPTAACIGEAGSNGKRKVSQGVIPHSLDRGECLGRVCSGCWLWSLYFLLSIRCEMRSAAAQLCLPTHGLNHQHSSASTNLCRFHLTAMMRSWAFLSSRTHPRACTSEVLLRGEPAHSSLQKLALGKVMGCFLVGGTCER